MRASCQFQNPRPKIRTWGTRAPGIIRCGNLESKSTDMVSTYPILCACRRRHHLLTDVFDSPVKHLKFAKNALNRFLQTLAPGKSPVNLRRIQKNDREEIHWVLSEEVVDSLTEHAMSCVSQVRSALDSLAYACAARAMKKKPEKAYFPIGNHEKEKGGARIRSRDLPDKIFDLFWSFEPFGERSIIYFASRINNSDKHQLIDPILSAEFKAERHTMTEVSLKGREVLTLNGFPLISVSGEGSVRIGELHLIDNKLGSHVQSAQEGIHLFDKSTNFDGETSPISTSRPGAFRDHTFEGMIVPLFAGNTCFRGRSIAEVLAELIELGDRIVAATRDFLAADSVT